MQQCSSTWGAKYYKYTQLGSLSNSNFSIISISYIRSRAVYLLSSKACMLMSVWVWVSMCRRRRKKKNIWKSAKMCGYCHIDSASESNLILHVSRSQRRHMWWGVLIIGGKFMSWNLHNHMRTFDISKSVVSVKNWAEAHCHTYCNKLTMH